MRIFPGLVLTGAIVLALASPDVAHAQERPCPTMSAPNVTITPEVEAVRYDLTRTTAELTQKHRASSRAIPDGTKVLGLAGGKMGYRLQTRAKGVSRATGGTCVYLTDVRLVVGYDDPTIYIARELPRGTCIHGKVVEHEQEHIRIDRRNLARLLPRLQSVLSDAAYRTGSVATRDPERAQQQLQDRLMAVIRPTMDDFIARRNAEQNAFDSPDEYRRIGNSCNGELRTYVR